MCLTGVELSVQNDHVFQLPGSDDSVSMEKQENAKMKIIPQVSMQPEWNNSCWYTQEAYAISLGHQKQWDL